MLLILLWSTPIFNRWVIYDMQIFHLSRTGTALIYWNFLHDLLVIDINLFKRLLYHIPRQICSWHILRQWPNILLNLNCLLKLWIISDRVGIGIKLILKAWFIKLMNIPFYFLDMLNPHLPDRVMFSYFSYLNWSLILISKRFLLLIPRRLPVSRIDIHRVMFIGKMILSRLFHGAFIGQAFKVIHALHRGEILGIDWNVLLVVASWQYYLIYSQFSLRHVWLWF